MATATLSQKGQIVIPAAIRTRAGLTAATVSKWSTETVARSSSGVCPAIPSSHSWAPMVEENRCWPHCSTNGVLKTTVAEAYFLDAYAVLALLGGEPGAEATARFLEQPHAHFFISAINVGEVYYILLRLRGEAAAAAAEAALYAHPKLEVVAADRDRIRRAGEIKAESGLSFANAFAAALSLELGAILVTGDPEFRQLEARGLLVHWLPGTSHPLGRS
ncbi:MAG: type II toxin-antitoxin system VapC family toxin [Firmicutes bacterium]|nr:type II toxin-antitoxin system VapC family toxin [Bacillota bacterium]